MIVRPVTLLWPAAVAGAVAALASLSPWLAGLPWALRFVCLASMIGPIGGLAWAMLYRRRPACQLTVNRLSEFLSVANHEMKTPLAGIKAYVELLADGDANDPATQEEFLHGIGSQAERLERAIVDLLELARSESVSATNLRADPASASQTFEPTR